MSVREAAEKLLHLCDCVEECINNPMAKAYDGATTRGMWSKARKDLAEAIKDEHQSYDGELWTDEWVKSIAPRYWAAGHECYWPDFGLRFAMKLNLASAKHGFYFWNEGERSHMQVPSILPIKTRGQVRALLKLLEGK